MVASACSSIETTRSDTCAEEEPPCAVDCADITASVDNCGGCGNSCERLVPGRADGCRDASCVCGAGALPCADGAACCGGRCVDLGAAHDNCGVCGRICSEQEVCLDGDCAPYAVGVCSAAIECPVATGVECTDLAASLAHCGSCGAACAQAQADACLEGACVCTAAGNSLCAADELCTADGCREVECGPATCPDGCCDSEGICRAASHTACGLAGSACVDCSLVAGTETDACGAEGTCTCTSMGQACPVAWWCGPTGCTEDEVVTPDVLVLSGPLCGLLEHGTRHVEIFGQAEVCPYDGNDNTGWVEIRAASIEIPASASIDATGAGFGGGGGGGGGGGADSHDLGKPCTAAMGGGGRGTRGGAGGKAAVDCGMAGSGGNGGGAAGGAGGGAVRTANNDPGDRGGDGGYNQPGVNTETSTDDSLRRGGGGGGGAGGRSQNPGPTAYSDGGNGSSGGGAGAPGGGYVRLVASSQIEVAGSISTRGRGSTTGDGQPGNPCPTLSRGGGGGRGGHADVAGSSHGGPALSQPGTPCIYMGERGGGGGTGAGGGLLFRTPRLLLGGALKLAGGSGIANGGTLKIFADDVVGSPGVDFARFCRGNAGDAACVSQ